MAALVKMKAGVTKVRIIHDLRRSGVNASAEIPERIVLPRLMDAAYSMIAVASDLQEEETVEVAVVGMHLVHDLQYNIIGEFRPVQAHILEHIRFVCPKPSLPPR